MYHITYILRKNIAKIIAIWKQNVCNYFSKVESTQWLLYIAAAKKTTHIENLEYFS